MSTTPGIHPSFSFTDYNLKERQIIESFSTEWYVTNSGGPLKLTENSIYKYFLIKPPPHIANLINIDREIVVILSPYETFEPRTLDAISIAQSRFQKLRVERLCSILVSADPQIADKLKTLLKNDQEAQIVVPFYAGEFPDGPKDTYYFRNRLTSFFFSRDLFAAESPLKTDLFFFGRRDIVHEQISRHRDGQVSGIFGLRKTGKTSLIYAITRALAKDQEIVATIDCQNPGFHQKRWNMALRHVLTDIKSQIDSQARIKQESYFSCELASDTFENELRSMLRSESKSRILIIFDEIENITPGVSPSSHWRSELDFVYFWQTLRSVFQKPDSPLTYLICGTNPLAVEQQTFGGHDNPIYAQIPCSYLPRFTHDQTREMVRSLGRIMGLRFEEHVYSLLNEDFGGHPYLIRHVCSLIHQSVSQDRPVQISTGVYQHSKHEFERRYSHFFEMILGVLREHFPGEYSMLRALACDDHQEFQNLSKECNASLNHLLGYGLIDSDSAGYFFRIQSLKAYISGKERYSIAKPTDAQKWNEISERRNGLETKLRKVIRNQLLMFYGKPTASEKVISVLSNQKKAKELEFNDLFNPQKNTIYFSDLVKILRKEWDLFEAAFGKNREKGLRHLEAINEMRADAHATSISEDEFQLFRIAIKYWEDLVQQFE